MQFKLSGDYTNLKYTIQQVPYDVNGDGFITQNDVQVYIAGQQLATDAYQIQDGQTIFIPFGSMSNPTYPKGAIVKIVYGIPNQ